METPRPVSMQRIQSVLEPDAPQIEKVGRASWVTRHREYVLIYDLENEDVLRFKGRSQRRFHGARFLDALAHYVTLSNRNRAFPKAYIEPLRAIDLYTVSAEVNRPVHSGLSELQFNAFVEDAAHALVSFFRDFENSAPQIGGDHGG